MNIRSVALALAFITLAPTAWGQSGSSLSPTPLYLDQLPREVQDVVGVRSWLEANHMTSSLEGATIGYLDVNIQIDTHGEFKVYQDKLKIFPAEDPILKPEKWNLEILKNPPAVFFTDPITHQPKAGYRGQSVFTVRAHLPKHGISKALPLTHKIPFVVEFQACSEKLCFLPTAVKIDFEITNQAKIRSQQSPSSGNLIENASSALKLRLGDSGGALGWLTLLITFCAGLITAFTPCVYPLYPITLGIFSRWSHAHKGASPFFMSLAYCAGMVLSYASLGLLTTATGAIFGSFTQTPLFLIGMGALILFSALVFEGFIDLKIFRTLQETFSSPAGEAIRSSNFQLYSKSFGMGTALGLVASPCVGPVLVVILAWLSQKLVVVNLSSMLTGFILLASFGVGMSLPFLIIGHFIFRLGTSPQLGRFTPYFKHLGTGLMVAASLIFLVPGIKLLLKSSGSVEAVKNYKVLSMNEWKKDTRAIIDFRADWCAACLELESETFSHPEVAKIFNSGKYIFVRVDMTEMTEKNQRIKNEFQVYGLPTIQITNREGKICKNETLSGFEDAPAFLARLERVEKLCQ